MKEQKGRSIHELSWAVMRDYGLSMLYKLWYWHTEAGGSKA